MFKVGDQAMGKIYDKMSAAKASRDIGAFNSCYHNDWNLSSTHLAA